MEFQTVFVFPLDAEPPAPPPVLSEAAGWLQQYLRIDTSNPPGNEGRAAAFLASLLQRAGIPSRVVATPEGRANLFARLASPRSGGRAVLLLHHMDVVPPGPGGRCRRSPAWSRAAGSGGAARSTTRASASPSSPPWSTSSAGGVPLERDVVFLAVADEENGGGEGTGWLARPPSRSSSRGSRR